MVIVLIVIFLRAVRRQKVTGVTEQCALVPVTGHRTATTSHSYPLQHPTKRGISQLSAEIGSEPTSMTAERASVEVFPPHRSMRNK